MSERHPESTFLLKSLNLDFIIFGVVAIILTATDLVRYSGTASNYTTALMIMLVVSVLGFIFGWVGFRRSDDPRRAGFFIVAGFVTAVLMIVSLLFAYTILSLIGTVMAVVYIIGGFMLRRLDSHPETSHT